MTVDNAGPRPILFVDLDGTLVLENSFHVFLEKLWMLGCIRTRAKLLGVLVMRVLRRRSGRVLMKRRCIALFDGIDPQRQAEIVSAVTQALHTSVCSSVQNEIDAARKQGARIVMATAAPALYAVPFASALDFDDCLSTPTSRALGWKENLGEVKAAGCAALMSSMGGAGRVGVVTDHSDDIPLMRLADRVVIRCSPADLVAILASLPESIGIRHLDSVSMQIGGGIWLWFDQRLAGPFDRWETRTILSKHRHALVFCGDGRWRHARNSRILELAVLRLNQPTFPTYGARLKVLVKRRVVRDWLGVFH